MSGGLGLVHLLVRVLCGYTVHGALLALSLFLLTLFVGVCPSFLTMPLSICSGGLNLVPFTVILTGGITAWQKIAGDARDIHSFIRFLPFWFEVLNNDLLGCEFFFGVV